MGCLMAAREQCKWFVCMRHTALRMIWFTQSTGLIGGQPLRTADRSRRDSRNDLVSRIVGTSMTSRHDDN